MGCGSLSTVAVQSNFGATWPARDDNLLRDKDNANFNVYDDKKINESSKLSLGYSPLKSESITGKSRNDTVSEDVQRKSNFNVFVKELDEEKYNIDDGGVWVGTDNADTDATPGLERSLATKVNRDEEASSRPTDYIKHKLTESPAKEVNIVCAEYATISPDGSDSINIYQHDKIQNGKTTKHEPSTANFSQSSSKQRRHLQRHRVHFESVEDKFSYNYGHFIDEDKQMSDSELADCEIRLMPSRTQETTLRFSECNGGHINPEQDTSDENLEACNTVDGSSKDLSVRKSKEKETDFKNKISEITTTGKTLEDFPTCADNPFIPQFVFKCVNYIEAVGLKTEGLYRICGNKAQAELFENNYLADSELDIATLEIPVNVIATVLKNFFNDLREALIPSNLNEELMKVAEEASKDSQLAMLGNIIMKLPPQNFEVFKYIITHLSKVAQHQEFNSMNSRNLAKCWWPTLIRLQFESYKQLVQESQAPEDVVQILIEQCAFMFHGESDV